MTSPYLIAVTAAAVTAAAMGGVYYAFSTIVMRGLRRTEPAEALTAMRGINTEAPANVAFLAVFLGSALLALGVGIAAAWRLATPGAAFVLAGAVLTVLHLVVTVAFNIPLNNALDRLDPSTLSAAEAAQEWRAYLVPWTNWNHVRTVAPLLGSALMLAGLVHR